MIIVRAPLRISFVGGGTDLPDFYHKTPGKVISAAINKYVYVVINPTPLQKGITAHYSIAETVIQAKDLKNNRIRETMLSLGIEKDLMEIGIFSHLPVGTGLGGSSSFTVGLVKGLSTYLGQRMDKTEIAELASKIEIERLKEPIGKQDHYAATFGGFNVLQFNPDESVDVKPLLIDYKTRLDFEKNLLVFFTGFTRNASDILNEQKNNTVKNMGTLTAMVDLVDQFEEKLMTANFKGLGELLNENWFRKKSLASKISSGVIDRLYNVGVKSGAWGGKILGAGGGGCILFLAPLHQKEKIKAALAKEAKKLKLNDFKEIPVKFVHSGVEIVSNSWFN